MKQDLRSVVIENILESVPVGLIVISPAGDIVLHNQASCGILGLAPGSFEGRGWGEIFFDIEKNIEFNQVILDVIRERKVNFRREVTYERPSGEKRRLSMTTSLLDEHGETAGLVVLIDDVTEIHAILQREKEILEERHRMQGERAESLRNLALAVAHQIRNPVTSIGGFAKRMLKKPGNGENNAVYLESILAGIDRLEEVVRAVREYADLPAVRRQNVPLARIVMSARSRLERRTREMACRIAWSTQVTPLDIDADPELLSQALEEILFNAVEALPGCEGRIALNATRSGTRVRITVHDSGCGIPEQDLPFLLDPFFTSKAVGVGLGLCKANRIIKEHRGEIRIESGPEEGTTVEVLLPLWPH